MDDRVCCLISSSSIPSHPDTHIIDETISSVRQRLDCKIIIMVDGLRQELAFRATEYAEYKRRVTEKYAGSIRVFDEFLHQANMTCQALKSVKTPFIFFLEHDTPLLGDIPVDGILKALERPDVNLIRLYHYSSVPSEHQYLFGSQFNAEVPLIRTTQWSQRPHFAKRVFYEKIMAENFTDQSRTYIEDKMFYVCKQDPTYGLWVYAPSGDMQRSTHSHGRGNDPVLPIIG